MNVIVAGQWSLTMRVNALFYCVGSAVMVLACHFGTFTNDIRAESTLASRIF